jgi:hypothetical protein
MGRSSRSALFPLSLVILPFLVLWRNSNLLFSGLGYIDPWVYYGFFRNLVLFKRELFPGTYYGSRLAWILPGYLVNRLFEPLTANYVLHLGVYFAAVVSLYYILARTINRPTGLMTAIVFGLHPYVWSAVGSDYIDGASIAYYLLTTALLTYAGYRQGPAWALTLAGISCAGLIYCNIAWIIFLPFFPAYYLWRRRQSGATDNVAEFGRFLLWMTAGAAVVTIVLGAINFRIDGHFWFYAPSLRFAASGAHQASQLHSSGLQWVWDARWLLFPGFTLLATLPAVTRIFQRPLSSETGTQILFAVNFLYCAAVYAVAEVHGNPMVEYHFYVSLLLPPAFLAVGALLFRLNDGWTRANLVSFAAAAILLAAPWWALDGKVWSEIAKLAMPYAACIGAGAVLWRTLQPRSRAALWALLLVLAACSTTVLWTDHFFMRDRFWSTGTQSRDGFLRITGALKQIETIPPDRSMHFWYDHTESNGNEFDSLSSVYLFQYNLIGRDFPQLPVDAQLPTGSVIVIPSSNPQAAEIAKTALAPRKLDASKVNETDMERGGVRYSLSILRARRDPASLQPLTLGTDGKLTPVSSETILSPEKWKLAGAGTMQRTGDGLTVTTPKDRWAYSAFYNAPFTAPSDGTYLFTLLYTNLSGSIQFGLLKDDRSVWLQQAAIPTRDLHRLSAECTLTMKAGQSVWLQTFNNQPEDNRASSFVIQELRAYRLR